VEDGNVSRSDCSIHLGTRVKHREHIVLWNVDQVGSHRSKKSRKSPSGEDAAAPHSAIRKGRRSRPIVEVRS